MLPLIREMRLADLEQVMYIERHAFAAPWSTLTYVYEIQQNQTTYMGLIELPEQEKRSQQGQQFERLQFLMRPFRSKKTTVKQIVAYGGVWIRMGEAHISTIASHFEFRGRGLGEMMLVALIGRGIAVGAKYAALEVRVSNTIAQNLYQKYGFVESAIIPQYYHDNREDAYLMKIPALDEAYIQHFKENVSALVMRRAFTDQFSGLHLESLDL